MSWYLFTNKITFKTYDLIECQTKCVFNLKVNCNQSKTMPFRIVLQVIYRFIHNERIVEKLSESYPIRFAAKIVSRFVIRGRQSIEDNLNNINKQEFIEDIKQKTSDNRLTRFSQRLVQEFKEEINNAKEELKRRQR